MLLLCIEFIFYYNTYQINGPPIDRWFRVFRFRRVLSIFSLKQIDCFMCIWLSNKTGISYLLVLLYRIKLKNFRYTTKFHYSTLLEKLWLVLGFDVFAYICQKLVKHITWVIFILFERRFDLRLKLVKA